MPIRLDAPCSPPGSSRGAGGNLGAAKAKAGVRRSIVAMSRSPTKFGGLKKPGRAKFRSFLHVQQLWRAGNADNEFPENLLLGSSCLEGLGMNPKQPSCEQPGDQETGTCAANFGTNILDGPSF